MGVAHLALDLGARHEGSNGVDDDEVDGTASHEHVGDFEGLLTGVGLRDQEGVDVDAELLGVFRVEGMLGVDKGGDATVLLRICDGVQCEGGLSRGFRAVDFNDATARQPTNAERDIQGDRPGRNGFNGGAFVAAEAHHRSLAELTVDLREGGFEGFFAVRL